MQEQFGTVQAQLGTLLVQQDNLEIKLDKLNDKFDSLVIELFDTREDYKTPKKGVIKLEQVHPPQ